MTPEKLIRMANQIAAFFNAQSRDQAPDAVAHHLRQFWDPRMRARFIEICKEGADGLDPSALEAGRRLEQGAE